MCLLKYQPQHQHHLHPCLWILTLWIFTFLRLLVTFSRFKVLLTRMRFFRILSEFQHEKKHQSMPGNNKNTKTAATVCFLTKVCVSEIRLSNEWILQKKQQHLTSNKQQGMFPTLRPTISAIHQTPGKKTPKSPVPCSPLPGEIRSVWFRKHVSPPHRFFRMAKKNVGFLFCSLQIFSGGSSQKKNGTIYI